MKKLIIGIFAFAAISQAYSQETPLQETPLSELKSCYLSMIKINLKFQSNLNLREAISFSYQSKEIGDKALQVCQEYQALLEEVQR